MNISKNVFKGTPAALPADGTPIDPSLVDSIARQVLAAVQAPDAASAASKGAVTASPSSWLTFAHGLEQLLSASPELLKALQTTVAKSARQVLANTGAQVPSLDDFLKLSAGGAKGGVSGNWWGFTIYLSHTDLQQVIATGGTIAAILAAVGPVTGSAAPWVEASAAFIAASLGLLGTLDHGNGVGINMSWFAPGVFVPTSN